MIKFMHAPIFIRHINFFKNIVMFLSRCLAILVCGSIHYRVITSLAPQSFTIIWW